MTAVPDPGPQGVLIAAYNTTAVWLVGVGIMVWLRGLLVFLWCVWRAAGAGVRVTAVPLRIQEDEAFLQTERVGSLPGAPALEFRVQWDNTTWTLDEYPPSFSQTARASLANQYVDTVYFSQVSPMCFGEVRDGKPPVYLKSLVGRAEL